MSAKLPPSSAEQWCGCSGWVQMHEALPPIPDEDKDDSARLEGIAVHKLAATLIWCEMSPGTTIPTREEVVGRDPGLGMIATDDMYDAAIMYCIDVLAKSKAPEVEKPIAARCIHSSECSGICDAYVWNPKKKTLYIWEYKNGRTPVNAFENKQCIIYAGGLLDKFGIDGMVDTETTVEIRVVQPHAYPPIKVWRVNAGDLRTHINYISRMAQENLNEHARCTSGPWCCTCTASYGCPTALRSALNLYEITEVPAPVQLSNAALGVQLSIVQRLKKRIEALETGFAAQAKAVIRSGGLVPGYRLGRSEGRITWARPVEEVFALGDMMGVDIRKHEAKTPKQVIKLGIDEKVIAAYSEKSQGSMKLKQELNARQIFSEECRYEQ